MQRCCRGSEEGQPPCNQPHGPVAARCNERLGIVMQQRWPAAQALLSPAKGHLQVLGAGGIGSDEGQVDVGLHGGSSAGLDLH